MGEQVLGTREKRNVRAHIPATPLRAESSPTCDQNEEHTRGELIEYQRRGREEVKRTPKVVRSTARPFETRAYP
jgi:hypothetical protein